MSVPARPDEDPDLLLSAALRDALAAIEQLQAENAELRARRFIPVLPKITDVVLEMVEPDTACLLIENGGWTQAAVDFVAVIPVRQMPVHTPPAQGEE